MIILSSYLFRSFCSCMDGAMRPILVVPGLTPFLHHLTDINICCLIPTYRNAFLCMDRASLAWMGPCFKLFMDLQQQTIGDLSDVDGLLGCPVALFPPEVVDTFVDYPCKTRELFVAAVFFTISWLRELVGVFANQIGPTAVADGSR